MGKYQKFTLGNLSRLRTVQVMKFATSLLILAAVLSKTLAQDAPAPKAPPARKAAAAGIVFRVEGGKSPLYLCGSIHVMLPSDYPLPQAYESAYKNSPNIVFEIPPADAAPENLAVLLQKYGTLESGTLKESVHSQLYKSFIEWVTKRKQSATTYASMQPWMVSLIVAMMAYEESGMKPEHGIDQHFITRSKKDDKSTNGLEGAEEQFKMLSGFDAKTQEDMLRQALAESEKSKEFIAKLLAAWRAGDTDQIGAVMEESFAKVPKVGDILLRDRNRAWVPKIEALLESSTPTMIIVGAGHLCGKDSVVSLLTKKGFKLTQLK